MLNQTLKAIVSVLATALDLLMLQRILRELVHVQYLNIAESTDFVLDVNEPPSEIKLSATTIHENEADAVVGKVTVSDPDVGQQHRCTVHDRIIDQRSNTGTPSQFFTVDSALNLKTLHGLNFEAEHSLDIMINCSDVVPHRLFKTELFTIVVKGINKLL